MKSCDGELLAGGSTYTAVYTYGERREVGAEVSHSVVLYMCGGRCIRFNIPNRITISLAGEEGQLLLGSNFSSVVQLIQTFEPIPFSQKKNIHFDGSSE